MYILYNKGDKPTLNQLEFGELSYNKVDNKMYTKVKPNDIVQIHIQPISLNEFDWSSLPTVDPHILGKAYFNNNILTLSQG